MRHKDAHLGLFVLPDSITERDQERTVGDYVSGMPVVLSVRLVNVWAKKRHKEASVINIPHDWKGNVVFSVKGKGQRVVSEWNIEPFINEKETKDEGAIDLFENEATAQWVISGAATVELEGEYTITTSWNKITARKIVLRFAKPETEEADARLKVSRAKKKLMQKDYNTVISMMGDVKNRHGEVSFGNTSVSLLLGDALAGVGRYNDALKAYEEFLATYRKEREGPRYEAPEAVLWKIEQVKKQLKDGKKSK